MKRIGIIFGGRSDEHEVSILSASSVINAIDKSKYEVVQIGISKDGEWYHIKEKMDDIISLDDPRVKYLISKDGIDGIKGDNINKKSVKIRISDLKELVDFAIPVLHGPYGEDGTIQGMFEILDIPYAGCGVASSALAMDKIFTKEICIQKGLPVCRHRSLVDYECDEEIGRMAHEIAEDIGYPLFVKPANMGSSVGITKAGNFSEFMGALTTAFKYDKRVIVEESIEGRELETSVLGNNNIEASVVGEIITANEFYDYKSKYKDGTTKIIIPADIPRGISEKIRDIAVRAFKAIGGTGFSRIDFFVEKGSGKILLNEINTIPGFTKYSMAPVLWSESGVKYDELIERIIDLGYERYNAKNSRQKNR